jgi:DNA repair exonuclease SbcCD ATPase subunit
MAFKLPGGKKFFRQDTLGDDYSVTAIMERLSGKRTVKTTSPDSFTQPAPELKNKPNLLIDIQKKMQEGYGQGFRHWASLQNVRSMAKTLMFMKENGLNDYEDLAAKQNEAAGKFHSVGGRIKELEERQNQISELQKNIGTYGKTKAAYDRYKRSGWDKDLYENERADVTLHQAAKKYFDAQGFKGKLPSINSLKEEWAKLNAEKRKLYAQYHGIKDEYNALTNALVNARDILDIIKPPQRQTRDYGAR